MQLQEMQKEAEHSGLGDFLFTYPILSPKSCSVETKILFVLTVFTESDVFCEEDGTREFGKQAACPACKSH